MTTTAPETVPIPMHLWCPKCGARHVDRGEFATKVHHTHACQNPECGLTWRPAVVPTVGVWHLPGLKDEEPSTKSNSPSPPPPPPEKPRYAHGRYGDVFGDVFLGSAKVFDVYLRGPCEVVCRWGPDPNGHSVESVDSVNRAAANERVSGVEAGPWSRVVELLLGTRARSGLDTSGAQVVSASTSQPSPTTSSTDGPRWRRAEPEDEFLGRVEGHDVYVRPPRSALAVVVQESDRDAYARDLLVAMVDRARRSRAGAGETYWSGVLALLDAWAKRS